MRKVHISHAKSGDVLAVDLFAANGSVLLSRGVRLTGGYIRSLEQKGIQYIYIDDRQTYDIRPLPLISPTVRQQAVKKVYETMTALIEQKKLLSRASSLDLGKEYEKVFKDILDYRALLGSPHPSPPTALSLTPAPVTASQLLVQRVTVS